jgi:histidinol dehydrogenase
MNATVYNWNDLDVGESERLLSRPAFENREIASKVAEIITAVRTSGDAALAEYSLEFDGSAPVPMQVPPLEVATSANACPLELLRALDNSIARIQAFHQAGMPNDTSIETAPGLVCSARYLPVQTVGLYIPGGSAPLISLSALRLRKTVRFTLHFCMLLIAVV